MPSEDGLPGEPPWTTSMPNNASVYHDDPECPHLDRDDRDPRSVSEPAVEWHELGLCPDCAGEEYRGTNSGTTISPEGVGDD